jgi:hypothetical protein
MALGQGGHYLTWGTKIVDILAASYLAANISATGDCQAAITRKTAKYATIVTTHIFIPITVEINGPLNSEAVVFLSELGRRLSTISDQPRETSFIFQRLSVIIQHFNATAFCGLNTDTETEGKPLHTCF